MTECHVVWNKSLTKIELGCNKKTIFKEQAKSKEALSDNYWSSEDGGIVRLLSYSLLIVITIIIIIIIVNRTICYRLIIC